jgi:hypothetical protein
MTISWDKPPKGPLPPPGDIAEVVSRRCKVCEWEGEMIEKAGADPDCPWCHAPTERDTPVIGTTPVPPRAKNPHAAALGRLGGLKGGRARAEALTSIQRQRIAARAARARWGRKDEDEKKRGNPKK